MGNGTQQQDISKSTETFGALTLEKSAELAAIAVAASARAEVESSYIMAIKNPRNEEDARVRILRACESPLFAAKARYRKPVGSKQVNGQWQQDFVVGPSIRFAEEIMRCWRNVLAQATTIYDDQSKRVVKITVRDLEANLGYSKEITLDKTVERRNAKDREVLGQRVNSQNIIVYVVKATEDELAMKEAANSSKVIRNNGLRLIPQHIVDEAMAKVEMMIREKVTTDPDAARRELHDGFAARGVMPVELERYMGMPIARVTPDGLVKLRDMLTTLEEGTVTWQEYLDGTTAEDAKEMSEKSQPGTKGATILDKIGPATSSTAAANSPASVSETKPKTQDAKQAEELILTGKQEKQKAEKAQASLTGGQTITDQEWIDILLYMDETPERSTLKNSVRERNAFGNLIKLHPTKRTGFVLSVQDAAKKAGLTIQQFIKE